MLTLIITLAIHVQNTPTSFDFVRPHNKSVAGLLYHGVFLFMKSRYTRRLSFGTGVTVV